MWLSRLFLALLLVGSLTSCSIKVHKYGEEADETSEHHQQEKTEVEEYLIPQIISVQKEGKKVTVRLKLSGKCEKHELGWISDEECTFELRDYTINDKCFGYQFVEEKKILDSNCEEIIINGITY